MAVKASLGDVHMMLMEQMQRLNESDAGSDEIDDEIARSVAMSNLAKQVVSNAALMVRVANMTQAPQVPKMLAGSDG